MDDKMLVYIADHLDLTRDHVASIRSRVENNKPVPMICFDAVLLALESMSLVIKKDVDNSLIQGFIDEEV